MTNNPMSPFVATLQLLSLELMSNRAFDMNSKVKDDRTITFSVVQNLNFRLRRRGQSLALILSLFVASLAHAQPSDSVSSSLSDSIVSVNIADQYRMGGFGRMLYGENYRQEWRTSVPLRMFDIGQEKGGLKIVQQGGGGQTRSLRLEAADGRQYVLRSVDKYPERNLPPPLASPLVVEVVSDQTSASHPYGALVVPVLAEAVGVYHTNPEIVYVPDDPRLEPYRSFIGNSVALFEERPDDDWSQADYFGRSEDIESSSKLLEELAEDNDNEVDARAYLRARLLDIVIGDWDRHEDNWRWASFDQEKGRRFAPIPRDRDQVFYVNEGVLHWIASQDFVLPTFQGFGETIRNINTWSGQSQDLDRRLLNELTRTDWQEVTQYVQQQLTDSVIEAAVQRMPPAIIALSGDEIERKLKRRRDDLAHYAEQYYTFLAQQVSVVGSDKHELFRVERLEDGQTRVTVEKMKKGAEPTGKVLFQRTFLNSETQEIRLFGRDGQDRFDVMGQAKRGIKLRIIGGPGEDHITDRSQVKGWGKKTKIYDTAQDTKLTLGPEGRDLTSDTDTTVNQYYHRSFQYNTLAPLVAGGYNRDDGISLGGGVAYTTQGFRKYPFATQHNIKGAYAFATSAFQVSYHGIFNQLISAYDLLVDIDVRAPNYVNNFFGLGNGASYEPDERDINYYRYRFHDYQGQIHLRRYLTPYAYVSAGPTYQRIEVEETPDRFITDFAENGLNPETTFRPYQYAGATLRFEINRLSNAVPHAPVPPSDKALLGNVLGNVSGSPFPTGGFYVRADGAWLRGLEGANDTRRVEAEVRWYHQFPLPKPLTLVTRVGGGHIFDDDFRFFQANTLGNLTNLRGYRRTRFHGQSSVYTNVELRMNVLRFSTYLAPIHLGVLAFNDVGRVWMPDDGSSDVIRRSQPSDTWHHGYGAGVYLSPFNMITVSAMWGFSREDSLPLIRFGFLF